MTTGSDLLARAPGEILPGRGERVLCAVSGGLDSMCLLHMLNAWCRERGGQLAAAHFNHRLREGTADRDEAFVREVCESWGIPLAVGRGDVRAYAAQEGQTVEEAARSLRYAFLRRAAAEEGCRRIYTAHHADDSAETVLLNLIRGTGLTGLMGIPQAQEGVFRPLLNVTRAELAAYAAAHGIPHVEDETNADPEAAARNLLRLRVMPLLKEINPRAAEHINGAAGRLRAVGRTLEEEVSARMSRAEAREGRVSFPSDDLIRAPEAVQPLLLLRLFDLLGAGRKDVGAVHVDAVLKMARRPSQGGERRLSLPRGVTARCRRGMLILEARPPALTEVPLTPGCPLRWGDYTLTLLNRPGKSGGIALGWRGSSEEPAVTVGPAVPGERLKLPGARGGRSVKRLCLDRRIPPEERERLPAIRVGGELAAVWRLGVDTEFLPEGKPVRFAIMIKHREADGI